MRRAAFTLLGLGGLTAVGIGWPLPLQASGELIAFTAGDVARAEDVNANFRKLDDAVVAARSDVNSLRGDVDDNSGDISRNASDIDDIEARLDVIEKSFVRAAYSQSTVFLAGGFDGTFQLLHSMLAQIPADGILVIMANVSMEILGGSGNAAQAQPRVTVDGTAVSVVLEEELDEPVNGDFNASAVTITCATAVTAGEANVALELRKFGDADVFVQERSITTFFLPFGNDGTQGVLDKALLDLDPDDRSGLGAGDPQQQ